MTNHKQAAEDITGPNADDWHNGPVAIAQQTEALVHATLYHAEQQRIANLIAWHGFVDAQGDLPDHASELAEQIHDWLGLS